MIIICITCIEIGSDAQPQPITGIKKTPFTYICDPARFESIKVKLSDFPYCDAKLPYPERAKDLVERMTLPEKVQQMGDLAYGVPRLGLPLYEWWSEALHGVSFIGRRTNSPPGTHFDSEVPGATSFPTVILTTASFNESLWKKIGQTVSTEARAMYNLGNAGLTFWSPNINVVRDPRWGRVLETPGEDPYVVGRYAINYVRGLQDVEGVEYHRDSDSRPLKISACCKHYAAYDLDNWEGNDRFHFDSRVTEQDMQETFILPFEMCVNEGDVSSVMCSYNRVNGIPTCADPKLLNQTIRGDWNFHGYIVSDCDSIQTIVESHKFLNDTKEDAVARVLKAGLDLDCGDYYTNFTMGAVQQGKIAEADIDTSLRFLYIVLMRLGYFDGSPQYKNLGKNNICNPQHIELAAEAARQGIVLLKNDNGALPLNTGNIKTLALVGPHANATKAMIGNYEGTPCRYTSPMDGFYAYSKVINYAPGCADIVCQNNSMIPAAIDAAKNADATVIVAGLDLSVEAEGKDRVDLLLPGFQTELINKVADAAKGPVTLVIMSAGAVDINFAKNNPKIKSILWVGYPGEEGGRAIADVIFGKYNPGGRLPITWYEANYVKIPYTSMPLRPVNNFPGRTYKFFDGPVVYPFGYGLSYTQFKYKVASSPKSVDIKLDKDQQCRDINYTVGTNKPPCAAVLIDDVKCKDYKFTFQIEVENMGKMDGSEVVMVYSKPPGIAGTHIKQVIGYERVFIAAGQSAKVGFTMNACKSLKIVDNAANSLLASGAHTILVGEGVGGVSFPLQLNLNH
ncbi:Fn3 like domain-containing protein [Citrus sinensis]|uniref:Fn3 like domain-containing protein n=1 Tax=Citrus sinensis TaxID=2711 RepID=A0ACB8NIK6_CITSI|nr:Fn3 like domain-containing protein [Citrus sinensis]